MDTKSLYYEYIRYPTSLELKGSFPRGCDDYPLSTTVTTPERTLLDADQIVPQDSLFHGDRFDRLCAELAERNKAMLVQDISRLLVPSAKHLAIYGDRHLDILIENVHEAWTECIPVEGPRPQPDYCVGFKRSAFTAEQLHKLGPLVGTVFDTSYFIATYRMFFPFFTCEVTCGATDLDNADRKNAHSMTVAVRGIVELYKAVQREKELDREILAFSVSHDHDSVSIYGHYPILDGDKVMIHRHTIHKFNLVEMNGRERWTTYRSTSKVYDIWMPGHLERICSAIQQLPSDLIFEVAEGPEGQSEAADV